MAIESLRALPTDSRVFIDANIFLYTILGHLILNEVVHKLMMDLSVQISERYRLLISDAVHIAIMKKRGIVDLASNDSDFERVAGINLWKPR